MTEPFIPALMVQSMVAKIKKLSMPGERGVWLLVLAFLALVGLLLAFSLRIQYERTLAETKDRLMAEARAADANVSDNLAVTNLLLANIIQMLQTPPAPRPAEFNAFLRQQQRLIPGIRTLLVTDKNGRIIFSNRQDILGYDARNRDYFKSAIPVGNGRLIITPPFKSVLGSSVVNITRVLPGPHGEFRGVVSASIDPDYFKTLLTAGLYSPDNRVLLVHSGGTVFISVPSGVNIEGKNLDQPGSFFNRHRDGGKRASVQAGTTAATGENRVLAFVTSGLPEQAIVNPLIVIASRDVREMLRPWRHDLTVQMLLYLLFSGITIATVILWQRRREEARKADEELLRLRSMESIGMLASGIAHDFNNMLTAIIGYIEIAKKAGQADEKVVRNLTAAATNCLRARELSQRLTIFSKGGSLVREIRPVAGMIRAGIEEAVKGSLITTEYALPGDLKPVLVDERQMRQVFFNLALNARDAMPEGGTLTVRAENMIVPKDANPVLKEGPYVRITMRDTGVGILPENLPRIFDPYFSTKEDFSRKGLGLGLAVCHAIVTRQGGAISAQSTVGQGTSIVLVVPAAENGASEARSPR